MKTYTVIYGYTFTTEMIEIDYSDGVGYILLHCVESSLNRECVVHDEIFPVKLDYDLFKYIHNRYIERKLKKV